MSARAAREPGSVARSAAALCPIPEWCARTDPRRATRPLRRFLPRRDARAPAPEPRRASIDGRRFLELFGVVERDHLVQDLGGVALEDVVQPVRREVDAVIGDPALGKVVGPDLLGTLAG